MQTARVLLGYSKNTEISEFASSPALKATEGCVDPYKREFLVRLRVIRETHNAASFNVRASGEEDDETSMASLEAFAEALGISQGVRAARRQLSARIETEQGRVTLRTLRMRAGLSQRELALRLGTSQPRIAALEAGRQRMGLSFGAKLAAILHVPVQDIVRAEEVAVDASV